MITTKYSTHNTHTKLFTKSRRNPRLTKHFCLQSSSIDAKTINLYIESHTHTESNVCITQKHKKKHQRDTLMRHKNIKNRCMRSSWELNPFCSEKWNWLKVVFTQQASYAHTHTHTHVQGRRDPCIIIIIIIAPHNQPIECRQIYTHRAKSPLCVFVCVCGFSISLIFANSKNGKIGA